MQNNKNKDNNSNTNIFDIFLKKYKTYTAIQDAAIDTISNGYNCIVIAPTGSGKTEAVMLPLLNNLSNNWINLGGINIIYITPLRALNRDMIKRIEWLCSELGISIAVRHGDTTQSERTKQARNAPQVLITTPETLQSILPTKSFHNALRKVKVVVVDEIHELYSSKRGAQLSLALERLAELASFQRVGISATVGDPESIKNFLCNENECKIISVMMERNIELHIYSPNKPLKALDELKEKFGLDSSALARLELISSYIKSSSSTLMFANTRQIVEALGSRLLYMNSLNNFGGIGVHHSSLEKEDRIELENKFKEGKIKSIIATSSLELGIDIGNIDLVIQYGSPRQAIRLIQRVGRSGHSISKIPKGIIISPSIIDVIESIAIFENVKSSIVEKFPMHFEALDVLATQICGIALDKNECTVNEAYSIIKRSMLYSKISIENFKNLLEFMAKQHLIIYNESSISTAPSTRMYYYEHLSVIPDTKRYEVRNIIDNKRISSLDERFVASEINEGSTFITKGLPWRVISIDEHTIFVEPSADLEAAIPDWTGEDIPVSKEVSEKVSKIFKEGFDSKYLNKELNNKLNSFIATQQKIFSANNRTIEILDNACIIHTWLGTLANEALARIISYLITSRFGSSVNIRVSPYSIFIESEYDKINYSLNMIKDLDIKKSLPEAVANTDIFRYKFIIIAKLFGIIGRESTISKNTSKKLITFFKDTPPYNEAMRELCNNYFDIEPIKELIKDLKEDRIKRIFLEAPSPISKAILESAYYTKELVMPILPSSALLESFANSLLSKKTKLICTYCGFIFTKKLSEVENENEIKCMSCGSTMIAMYDERFSDIIKKRKSKPLIKKEKETEAEMMKLASLIQSYGGRAVIALSTYGIGPTSSGRILMMLRRDNKLFFLDLLEAQRQFIKNKKYWSVH
ncbi:MAG: DEAD/DEAH box helicase [Candidatus Marsarchaeota archaeon]|jgi:ATP-dependent Lhr-like helicase|nr:DEAD/DEAH box helicase [Candidatus Marsarchaeota archaeon]